MTILNQTTELIQEGYTWGFNFSWWNIVIFIFGILALIACIYFIIDDGPDFCMSFAFILGIAVVICCFHTKPVYKEISQYEVIISEDTSFYDIYNNYDVIEQRGEIFILQEKNQNNG